MLKMFGVVLKRELIDFIRDKRSVKAVLTLTLTLPLLYAFMIGFMEKRALEVRDKEIKVAYIASKNVDHLLPFLRQQGVKLTPIKAINYEAFNKKTYDLLLSEQAAHPLKSPDDKSFELEVWAPGNDEKANNIARRLANLLSAYAARTAEQTLMLRGIDPQFTLPFAVKIKSVIEDKEYNLVLFDLLVGVLGIGIFVASAALSTDVTAGERERQTLEALLYTSTPRWILALGKIATVVLVSVTSTVLTGLVFWATGAIAPLRAFLGTSSSLELNSVLWAVLIMASLIPLACGLQILIGACSRTIKEAGTYNSMLAIISLPLSFGSMLEKVEAAYYLPGTGQALFLRQFLREESLNVKAYAVAQGLTLLIAVLLIGLVVQRFSSEKIIRGAKE